MTKKVKVKPRTERGEDRESRIVITQWGKYTYWLALHSDGSFASGRALKAEVAEQQAVGMFHTPDTSVSITWVKCDV